MQVLSPFLVFSCTSASIAINVVVVVFLGVFFWGGQFPIRYIYADALFVLRYSDADAFFVGCYSVSGYIIDKNTRFSSTGQFALLHSIPYVIQILSHLYRNYIRFVLFGSKYICTYAIPVAQLDNAYYVCTNTIGRVCITEIFPQTDHVRVISHSNVCRQFAKSVTGAAPSHENHSETILEPSRSEASR